MHMYFTLARRRRHHIFSVAIGDPRDCQHLLSRLVWRIIYNKPLPSMLAFNQHMHPPQQHT